MRFYFSNRQLEHRPTQYGVHGRLVRPLENPERGETLIASLEGLGLERGDSDRPDRALLGAIHADHYIDFLQGAHERFAALPNAGPEVLPNVHPYFAGAAALGARPRPRTTGILGQAGWYIGDLSCAMTALTFEAALASAGTAVSAASAVAEGEDAAFALCRPPGHHAYADRASGFCFLNNAALAAERLRRRYEKVAILDFDTHHGDGTQTIFYERGDVFVGSVHTDPSAYYPHYLGYADETGAGAGLGANLNIPLPFGSNDEAYLDAVERLAGAIAAFGAQALVVSAGWDAHREDPLSKLDVTTAAYPGLGAIIGGMGLPTAIVQEGGYSLAAVAEAAPAFLSAFLKARV